MIEAVNSVLSNAPLTKAVIDQQSVARSFAANPTRIQESSTVAPYISLYIKVDTNFDKAILQIRDSDTGDVVRQIPSETQLEAYRRAQQVVSPQVSSYEKTVNVPGGEVPQVEAVEVSTPNVSEASAPSVAPAPQQASAPTPQAQTTNVDTSA